MLESMKKSDECEWLQEYVRTGCEASFSQLVDRHVAHVYSTALRRVAGERGLAEDVTQAVFLDLAKKAASLPPDVVLAGWLHKHTCFLASRAVRSEVRRRQRESAAAEMNQLNQDPADAWRGVEPLVDELLGKLSEADRNAVLLRFFEKLDLRSVGSRLGISEDAAQKRVSRALERLRGLFHRRGAAAGITVAILSDALANHAVASVPSSLAAGCKSAALAAATSSSTSIIQLTYLMTKSKIAFAAAGAIATAVIVIPLAHHERQALRDEVAQLRAKLATRPAPPALETNLLPTPGIPATSVGRHPRPEINLATPTVNQIVESLRTSPPDGFRTADERLQFETTLAGLDQDRIVRALKVAAKITDLEERRRVVSALLKRWVEIDGAAALAYAENMEGALHLNRFNALASRWAAIDPAAAIAWHRQREAKESAQEESELAAYLAHGAAHGSFDLAIDFAMNLPDAKSRQKALGRVSRLARDEQRIEMLRTALDQFENPDDRTSVMADFASGWAASDPQAAAAWVETIAGRERHRIASSVFNRWIYYDPEAAADFYSRTGDPRSAVSRIVLAWGDRDPVATGDWLRRQPKETVNDAARGVFASLVAESHPETALEWANTISDAKVRRNSFEEIAFYYVTGDLDAAKKFIAKSDWPTGRIAELNKALGIDKRSD